MKLFEIHVYNKHSATRTTSVANRLQKVILALDAMTKNTANFEQECEIMNGILTENQYS
jgi:hypothetical protein